MHNEMNILLTPETQKLLEQRMRKGGYSSPDAALREALVTLEEMEGAAIEDLDEETQLKLERAAHESSRGEGRPWADVREELEERAVR